MGLDFTNIEDKEGAACYILHDGSMQGTKAAELLCNELRKINADHQIEIINVRDGDGERIRSFYGLTHAQIPAVLVVRDDDQLAHHWTAPHLPTPSDISYALRQISA